MVKSTITLLAVSAIASVALAQTPAPADPGALAFGAPVSTTVWTAGTSATVSWNNDCSDLPNGTNTTFPITLNLQVNGVQQPVAGGPIGTLDCSEKGSTTVQVPNVPSGELYSILASPGGVLSYSALFKIVGTATNTTTVAPTLPATTTTGSSATATGNGTTATKTLTSVTQSPTAPASAAGALKVGSTAALVVLAGVASMML
ncbi:hypothetical protein BGZ59_005064 [Podila verticillata]|nr:hypothetical protein BGZ59_005064 [Podila verticillata]